MVFHVLNRGVARMQLFEKPADYQAFERVLQETLDERPMHWQQKIAQRLGLESAYRPRGRPATARRREASC
jgi:hypothetical protein